MTINAGTMNTKTMQQSDFVYDKEKVELGRGCCEVVVGCCGVVVRSL